LIHARNTVVVTALSLTGNCHAGPHWPTTLVAGVFLLVLASSLLGIWMLRNQKLGALITLTSVVRQGQQVPCIPCSGRLRYALSGLLFAIPGILSDVLAILLLCHSRDRS
jgi:UPF0716 family protein affecting phage T7 exclusion